MTLGNADSIRRIAPFVNGANRLDVSVSDYGANAAFATRIVYVDNATPTAAFVIAQPT